MITIGSLFAGIGGLELGIEWALAEAGIPARVAWQVEIDPFCRAVLAKHWPDADRSTTDVRSAASLPRVDVICGGFPCQDVSGAGLGAGLAGARSGLWYAYLATVDALRPRVVVVENVASGKARWLCEVRTGLQALGYRTRAIQIGAHDVGAPHRRERVFVVAYADGHDLRQQPRGELRENGAGALLAGCAGQTVGVGLADADCLRALQPSGGEPDERRRASDSGPVADAVSTGRDLGTGARADGAGGPAQPCVGRGADGLPGGMGRRLSERWPAGRGEAQHDWEAPRTVHERQPQRRARLKALGNAVVPQCAMAVARAALVPLLGGAT